MITLTVLTHTGAGFALGALSAAVAGRGNSTALTLCALSAACYAWATDMLLGEMQRRTQSCKCDKDNTQ